MKHYATGNNTIQDARLHFKKELVAENECKCPVCEKTSKIYRRKLNHGMAMFLIHMYQIQKQQNWIPVHSREVLKSIGQGTRSLDFSVLRHFGLIEQTTDPTTSNGEITLFSPVDKRTLGYWQLTPQGRRFVERRAAAPCAVHILNNILVGTSEETTTITSSLGEEFKYSELMGFEPHEVETTIRIHVNPILEEVSQTQPNG